jgi:hypothetical protein
MPTDVPDGELFLIQPGSQSFDNAGGALIMLAELLPA